MKKLAICAFLVISSLLSAQEKNKYAQDYTKYPNLALTPPMGWNSWNKFACNVDENLIKEIADAMVSTGMRDAGYTYINIDDCWHGDRDANGFIHPDPKRFPSGMKALADYIHSKGLKIGIYSDAGALTCGGRPGSRGFENQDAKTYADWGIDYLKYDWCSSESLSAEGAYKTMAAALKRAGRPIVLSICEWGDNKPWDWGKNIGHLWRTTGDIYNCFDCIEDHGTWKSFGVLQILDKQEGLRKFAGPGHWNDPDMMEIGNGNLTAGEERAHFSMWTMLAAPLIAGNDIRNMNAETLQVLTNKKVIAVNQDKLGVQGLKYKDDGDFEIWFKPLENGDWAVAFLNRNATPKTYNFDWKNNQFTDDEVSKLTFNSSNQNYSIENLWTDKKMGNTNKSFKFTVPGKDILMLRLSPAN
ncbi:alpha-galactosidase [Kaistella treverensis]|uniref:Alpha-galactosidase n=1 Tax=Kaistella treverensis TaxID=631455 RepID=A0A1I3LH79_9FLAO|nr:glycoside hydrolase family 27 protein [Kaistella treverensis]SFI84067.1 alpha-galactosidase [Kaistella treverensis]